MKALKKLVLPPRRAAADGVSAGAGRLLVLGAVHFGSDAAARAQGRLAEETIAVADWQLVGLVQARTAR